MNMISVAFQMKEYEDKIKLLEKTVEAQKKDIDNLKNIVKNLDGD